MKKITQANRVLDYIRQFGSISPLQGFIDLGVTRLAAVIYDLKQEGFRFNTVIKHGKNRFGNRMHYAVYSLKETSLVEK